MNEAPPQPQRRRWIVRGLLVFGIILGIVIILYTASWSGFNERPNAEGKLEPARTLWDWLELLIVPAILALGALWFNNQIRDRERALERARIEEQRKLEQQRIEEQRALEQDRFKEEALQAYFDRMTELLLTEKLNSDEAPEEVRGVASLRTITVLRRLDQGRRDEVIGFLRDSGLLMGERSILAGEAMEGIDLSRAKLSKTHLMGAHLRFANLTGADLSEANLSGAFLISANLFRARLSKANLSGAFLVNANLSGASLYGADLTEAMLWKANLSEANLSGADLQWADLTDAKVTPEQLTQAILDENTIMPDGKKRDESSFMNQDGSEPP